MTQTNYFCVIMAGGIGSRFWPLSKEEKPKQFLDILGIGESLLQTTYRRFSKIIPQENILIATNTKYRETVLEQLPQLTNEQVLCEPMRRGTLPCAACAAYRIAEQNPQAVMVVAPCDHWISDESLYLQTVSHGLETAAKQNILITLGIKPHRPETSYGYVQAGDESITSSIKRIKTFTEKPNTDLANLFYESGEYLWNSGLFVWNVQTIKHTLRALYPNVTNVLDRGIGYFNTSSEAGFINQSYPFMPNVAIDFDVMEKADNSYVLEGNFGWCDVGTWGALHDLSHKDNQGNVRIGGEVTFYDATNNIVSTMKNRSVIIQGLNNYIVTETDEALLICKRTEQQRIKQFIADIKFSSSSKPD